MVETVLCYIEDKDSYLMLLRNKRNQDMNKGKWIGIGGHIEIGETPEEALVREVYEETNLTLLQYTKRGILRFINDDYIEIIHLYTSSSFCGTICECNEGTLAFIPKGEILSLNLWEGDRCFLPRLLQNDSYFEMNLYYKDAIFIRSENCDISGIY